MKLFGILLVLVMPFSSFAQNEISTLPVRDEAIAAQGIRVSFLAPSLQDRFRYSKGSTTATSKKEALNSSVGVSVGYASLPINDLGWTTNLAYIQSKYAAIDIGAIRADGNFALAFTKSFNAKIGINFTKFLEMATVKNFRPNLGYQAGVGYQFYKNFSADLAYVQMAASGDTPFYYRDTGEHAFDAHTVYQQMGPELSVSGTF
ncbi:MAG: hypothetical protein AB7O96_10250 [Pseudobdellovibrionaceae bacterium]